MTDFWVERQALELVVRLPRAALEEREHGGLTRILLPSSRELLTEEPLTRATPTTTTESPPPVLSLLKTLKPATSSKRI